MKTNYSGKYWHAIFSNLCDKPSIAPNIVQTSPCAYEVSKIGSWQY